MAGFSDLTLDPSGTCGISFAEKGEIEENFTATGI
jgi:hypothetical protein